MHMTTMRELTVILEACAVLTIKHSVGGWTNGFHVLCGRGIEIEG